MRRRLVPVIAVAVLFLLAAPVGAAEDPEALAACGTEFDRCTARCELSYREDAAARAGCQAACAADRAVCEAKAGYEAAKPWVAEQFRNMQRFFEGFSEKGGQGPQSPSPGDPDFTPLPEPEPEREAGPDDPDAPYKDI
ncbi:hypothetical protein C882_1713 [Caenispirillum salinarum AK4]|uniref:Uncharacterized protein n=1 Tax=Caenispirillum salinarum AK4 TaxID=1238182 RepID=K9H3L8_9PROT|nr:hypothetical protein [Caenispirillum salinarum]EKV32875.1 hypothetical protein C882_1713 [Caenispirillum salinarum AK4]